MKNKKQVLQFLEDNYCMINSLMCQEERKIFKNDVVAILETDIKKQIERDEANAIHQSKIHEIRQAKR